MAAARECARVATVVQILGAYGTLPRLPPALVFSAPRDAHVARKAVTVHERVPDAADATRVAVIYFPRGIVLPQVTLVTIVPMLDTVVRALGICAGGRRSLHHAAKMAEHAPHFAARQGCTVLLFVTNSARRGRAAKWVHGRHPSFVVRTPQIRQSALCMHFYCVCVCVCV